MSFYFRSFDTVVPAFAFFLYGHKSLDRLMIFPAFVMSLHRCIPASLHSHTSWIYPSNAISLPLPISSYRYIVLHICRDLFCCAPYVYAVCYRSCSSRALSYNHCFHSTRFPDFVTRLLTIELFLLIRMRNPTACMHPLRPPS